MSVDYDFTVTVPCPALGETWAVTCVSSGRLFRREFTITMLDKEPSDESRRRYFAPVRPDRSDTTLFETSVNGRIYPNGINVTTVSEPVPVSWISSVIVPGVTLYHPPELMWNGNKFVPKEEKSADAKAVKKV